LYLITRPRRPRRQHEWSAHKAVTFIVTLRNVTLTAKHAGMSRKSAYALKERDPAFADAWKAAKRAGQKPIEGDKVDEVDGPPCSPVQGNDASRSAPSSASTVNRYSGRHPDAFRRDLFFARLAARASGCG
jgi:hypothetical protein